MIEVLGTLGLLWLVFAIGWFIVNIFGPLLIMYVKVRFFGSTAYLPPREASSSRGLSKAKGR